MEGGGIRRLDDAHKQFGVCFVSVNISFFSKIDSNM